MTILSVIIAAHNAEQTLSDTLESLLRATGEARDDIEVILLNDSSDDATQDIVDAWASRFSCFISEQVNYRNIGQVRNHAVSRASGCYIMMLDSDDLLKPGSLEDAVAFLRQHQPDMLLTRLVELYDKSKISELWSGFSPELLTKKEAIRRFLIHKDFQAHLGGQFIHRKLYQQVPVPAIHCYEDFAVFPEMLMLSDKIFYQRQGHYCYVKNSTSLSGIIDAAKVTHLVNCTLRMEKIFPGEFRHLINCHWLDIFTKHKKNLSLSHLGIVKERMNQIYSVAFFLAQDVRFSYKKKAVKVLWKK